MARARPPIILVVGILFAFALALYWSALGNPPVFDDRLLREDVLRFYGTSWFKLDLRWLSYATFGWTYDLLGKDWFWYRLGNVLLHATTAFVLYLFLARLFEVTVATPATSAPQRVLHWQWIAFSGALIFLLHPVAVYGVAYLVQRSIIMATLFSLLCLRLVLEGLVRQSQWQYLAAAAAYFLAVFSKEHSIMVPAVIVALAVLVRGPSFRLMRQLGIPLTLCAAIAVLVILRAKGYLGAQYEPFVQEVLPRLRGSEAQLDKGDAYFLSLMNQAFLFFRYLLVWAVPYPGWMSIDLRPPFPALVTSMPHILGFAAFLAYAMVAAALLFKRGLRGLAGFGLLFPWLLALTEMATVRVQEPFVLYRSYLWMSGLAAILPALVQRLRARWSAALLSLACVALILPQQNRLDTFSSPLKLWDDVVRKNTDARAPFVERGYHNRGFAYLELKQYPEALRDFNRAIELNARDASAYVGRGVLRSRTGSQNQALADLDRAVAIDPRYAEAYAKRCFVKMMLDQPADALPDCKQAVALEPRHRDALTNLGVVYAALNRVADAEASYRRALNIDAANADANYNYGVLLMVLGRRDEARHRLVIGCNARSADACRLLRRLR